MAEERSSVSLAEEQSSSRVVVDVVVQWLRSSHGVVKQLSLGDQAVVVEQWLSSGRAVVIKKWSNREHKSW